MEPHELHLRPFELAVVARLAASIRSNITARGRSYANARHIRLAGRAGDEVLAEISGTLDYTTTINVRTGKGKCSCPAPRPCKHVAALCRYILHGAPAQELFDTKPAAIDDTPQRLALLFGGEDSLEIAVLAGTSRLLPLNKNTEARLPEAQRNFLETARMGKFGKFKTDITVQLLMRQPQLFEEIACYFGREPFPRKFAGFIEAHYEISERRPLTPDMADRQGFADAYFEIAVHRPLDGEWLSGGDFYYPADKNRREFAICSALRDGIDNDLLPLDEIVRNPRLLSLLPESLRHEWENRVALGPRRVLSFYAITGEHGKFGIEAELAFGYARDEKAFTAEENADLPPLYTIVPNLRHSPFFGVHASNWNYINPAETFETVIHKTGAIIVRNLRAEHGLAPLMRRSKQLPIGRLKVARARYLEFLEKTIPYEKKNGTLVRIHSSLAGVFTTANATIDIKSTSGIDWFEGALTIEGFAADDVHAIMRAHRKKEDIVQLSGGRWFSIQGSGVAEVLNSLANVGLRADSEGKIQKISYAALVSLEQEKQMRLRTEKGAGNALSRFRKFAKNKVGRVEPPSSFRAKLRPYQQVGASFIMKLYVSKMGGILADDMGLGKTVQSIAVMTAIAAKKKQARFLIICPLAAMGVWQHEISQFAPDLKCYRWHGQGRAFEAASKAQVVISSFATFALDAEKFADTAFSAAFVDEAQFAKNHKSRAASALRQIRSSSIICLTGTPVENHLEDLWALFDVFFPGYLGTLKAFKNAFGGQQGAQNIATLRQKIAPFLLRRTKAEVLADLPDKTEMIVRVPMPPEQAKVYEAARQAALLHLGGLTKGQSALFEMLRHLMNLRRIACHPYLEAEVPDPLLSGKLQYLDEKTDDLAETATGVLVFSQFTSVLKVAVALLKKRGIDPLYLDGQTTEKRRRELVQQFQAGEKKFFLISLKAGGTALTLTQADTVIHLDPWWNPAVENQASDRAHRIGQKRRVFVYKLVSEKTVEEKVLLLQEKKRELFNALLGESGADTQAIGREEIEYILGD